MKENWQIMMTAHSLCPVDISHPEKMRWIAEYFERESGAAQDKADLDFLEERAVASYTGLSVTVPSKNVNKTGEHRFRLMWFHKQWPEGTSLRHAIKLARFNYHEEKNQL